MGLLPVAQCIANPRTALAVTDYGGHVAWLEGMLLSILTIINFRAVVNGGHRWRSLLLACRDHTNQGICVLFTDMRELVIGLAHI